MLPLGNPKMFGTMLISIYGQCLIETEMRVLPKAKLANAECNEQQSFDHALK